MYLVATASAKDSSSTTISVEGITTLVVVGLALLYWCFYRTQPISPPTDLSINSARETRFITFIEHEISTNETVLFIASKDHLAHFQDFFNALRAPFHVVNLSRIAGGTRVMELLRERYKEPTKNEFLFRKGTFVGGSQPLRSLLVEERQTKLNDQFDWSRIRLDTKSNTGVLVLSPMNGFQCVQDSNQVFDVATLKMKLLHTVLELRAFDIQNLSKCRVPIALKATKQRRRSKLLVCYDMTREYKEDRFKHKLADLNETQFYQWDLVDVFVSFSHALVSPPPSGWIAAGHRHGAQVLGTLLTKGPDGINQCNEIFKDTRSAETFASKLAAIARQSGFDGWLIVVQNDVSPELVMNIHVFLRTLSTMLQLHNPLAHVIWNGSLSRSGKKCAYVRFDDSSAEFVCNVDGFFANDGWTSEDAKFSAAFDRDRRYNIYMGIDVPERHEKLDDSTIKCSELLRQVWNSGVSAALRISWQHLDKVPVGIVENSFWNTVRQSWKKKSPCYDALGGENCFYTAFNVGYGVGVWVEGSRVSSSIWSDVTEQSIQPDQALHTGASVSTATGSMEAIISYNTAFQGGASVQIQGQLFGREKAYFKLFDVDIEFSPLRTVEISYTTAVRDDFVCLLVLTVCPGLDCATHYVILRSKDNASSSKTRLIHQDKIVVSTVAKASMKKHLFHPIRTDTFNIEGVNAEVIQGLSDGWCKKTYRIGGQLWDQKHIVEIGVLCTKNNRKMCETSDFLAYLGEICVVGSNGNRTVDAVYRSVHSQPKSCENARLVSFKRNSPQSVSLAVEWDFALDGMPVRYVVGFACTEDGKRLYLGKSFYDVLEVDACDWKQEGKADSSTVSHSSARLTLELQSISWTGQSGLDVCRLHLKE